MASTYWERNGKEQKRYEELWEKLVPVSGPAKTKAGELLRAVSRVYYRWFNDGDRISLVLTQDAAESSTVNGWGFLYAYQDKKAGFQGEPLAWAILEASSEKEYEAALEKAVDAVLVYVGTTPDEVNDTDFTNDEYAHKIEFEIESSEEE